MTAALIIALAVATPAAPGWTALAPGAEHLRVEEGGSICSVSTWRRIAPTSSFRAPRSRRPRPRCGGRRAPRWWSTAASSTPRGARSACDRRRRQLIGLRKVVDWGVLVLRPGRAAIVHSREYPAAAAAAPAVTGAIQVGPRILVDGRVPGLKPQAARRTAVAIDHGGRFLTVVVADARMQAADLGRTLAGFGFSDALMLDGGPSTQLSAAIGDFSRESRAATRCRTRSSSAAADDA